MASFKSIVRGEGKSAGSQKFTKRKFKRYRKNKRRRKSWSNTNQVHQPLGNSMQCTWFWQNYFNSLEWIGRHQVGYWKSRALALEHENNLLQEYVQTVRVCDDEIVFENKCNNSKKVWHKNVMNAESVDHHVAVKDEDTGTEEEDEDNFEFEITEEMLEFFEQSIRHKMELKKQREEEGKLCGTDETDSDGNTRPPAVQVGIKRTQEMQLLYGKASPMILGMETAMQLGFDRNCDLGQPKLWPNLPLKLSTAM